MTPPKTALVLTVQLPCGCVLSGQIAAAKPKTPESIARHSESVQKWLADRWGRHDCYLVSSSNSNGLAPRTK